MELNQGHINPITHEAHLQTTSQGNSFQQLYHQHFSNHLIMVRPYKFYSNQQTSQDNIYQSQSSQQQQTINKKALQQFDNFVSILRQNQIKVTVVQDPGVNQTPDSVFPNNWISFHPQSKYIIYPMKPLSRRKEKLIPVIQQLQKQLITQGSKQQYELIVDYTNYEQKQIFLEGTGSMVLDKERKIVYAVLSQRTNIILLNQFCKLMGYQLCSFKASQKCQKTGQKLPIYHTNVLMSVSRHFISICFQLIDDQLQRKMVRQTIERKSKKQIMQLTSLQILNFTGNMITVTNAKNQDFIILSKTAAQSLRQDQLDLMRKYVKLIEIDVDTIEKNGGGSVRCMVAEVF